MQQLNKGKLLHGSTYRIEKVLGQGSFGITYLATHTALNKKVAIKEFFMKELNGRSEDGSITGMSDGSLSLDYARKFQKETLNLARLEHPNIVRVTESFTDNGTYYYVMDYIKGKNLNDYVKTHHVSQQEAVDIIRDVAKALMYMHEEKHMLHLDIKPGNIMRRTSDGHIFLIDFGLSKHYSNDGQPETSTTIGLGTAGYAPIEQANRAKKGEFRPSIDVYALGATLYKLLTRETPPAASELVSDDELLNKNLKKYGINTQLSQIVIWAMLPNVKKRTQSIREFLLSLPYGATDDTTERTHVYISEDEETIVNSQPTQEKTIVESSAYSSHTPKIEEPQPKTSHAGNVSSKSFFVRFIRIILRIIVAVFFAICIFMDSVKTKLQDMQHNINIPSLEPVDTVCIDELAVDTAEAFPSENGYQELTYSDNSTYEGYMENGLYEGQGTYTNPKLGYTYEGNWHQGTPSGYGVQVWTKAVKRDEMCRYEGNFKDGYRSGEGTGYFADKTYCKGKWKKGEIVSITEDGTWN